MSEPQPRPAEPSVGDDQSQREQGDDADMGDPESAGEDPESRWERGKQRESGSMSLMAKKVMKGSSGGDRREMGATSPSSQTRSVLSPRLSGRTQVE